MRKTYSTENSSNMFCSSKAFYVSVFFFFNLRLGYLLKHTTFTKYNYGQAKNSGNEFDFSFFFGGGGGGNWIEAVSGATPEEPVVSKNSGLLFEKSLIEKYIDEHKQCPITKEPLTLEDLLPLKTSTVVKPRSGT